MILLVTNYLPDQQQSMLRFSRLLETELRARGLQVETIAPPCVFGRLRPGQTGLSKWLGYLDKFLLLPFRLRWRLWRLRRHSPVVHICDHSNAVYCTYGLPMRSVVTCHDLLAVRGALGEDTGCPASGMGRLLQRWICAGLARADRVVAVSHATRRDLEKLVPPRVPQQRSVAHMGLNHPYHVLPAPEVEARLRGLPFARSPFLLHIGSNLERKNRQGALRVFARLAAEWPELQLVFVGVPLSPALEAEVQAHCLTGRVHVALQASNDLLEALYNQAFALLFPSLAEGFGWPIIEAQACGCPALTSDRDALPEVAGAGARIRDCRDEAGLAEDLRAWRHEPTRAAEVERGFRNVARFTVAAMVEHYLAVYRSLD